MMEEMLREPVELTESELDQVAGGKWEIMIKIGTDPHKTHSGSVSQTNSSVNLVSTGNNNNGVSGNQFYFG
jgi:hypothetical protein